MFISFRKKVAYSRNFLTRGSFIRVGYIRYTTDDKQKIGWHKYIYIYIYIYMYILFLLVEPYYSIADTVLDSFLYKLRVIRRHQSSRPCRNILLHMQRIVLRLFSSNYARRHPTSSMPLLPSLRLRHSPALGLLHLPLLCRFLFLFLSILARIDGVRMLRLSVPWQ